MKSLFHDVKQLTAQDNLQLSKGMHKGDPQARLKMIKGNAGFAYKRAIRYASMNVGWTQIDEEDILQAALVGLIEAVDRYDPEREYGDPPRPYAFTTYANFWIIKLIGEEISTRHWNTMRPPRKAMREFLYKKMDYNSSGEYIQKYMDGSSESLHIYTESPNDYLWSDIMISVDKANLSPEERRVFDCMYGDNPTEDDLSDLTRGKLGDIEFNMLNKIKGQL